MKLIVKPSYQELVDSLACLADHFMTKADGTLNHHDTSACECAISTLTNLGLVDDGKLTQDIYDQEYMTAKFGSD